MTCYQAAHWIFWVLISLDNIRYHAHGDGFFFHFFFLFITFFLSMLTWYSLSRCCCFACFRKFFSIFAMIWCMLQTKLCLPDPSGTKYAALVYSMSLCHLRLISFGVDLIDDLDKRDHLESFYRILAYTLYFPTFLTGPFHSYKKFINCVSMNS